MNRIDFFAALGLAAVALVSVLGPAAVGDAASSDPTIVSFDHEAVGGPPLEFEPVVGDWRIAELAGAHGLFVDGARWRQGAPSANLADQARKLYGERYAEFLDGVKAFAFFPLAVWKGECAVDGVQASVRFYPEAGRIDQAAGIAWSILPDGSYFGARANGLEDNLLFFRVVRGKRTIIENVRGVTTASRQWHTLSVLLEPTSLKVDLDGKQVLKRDEEQFSPGRCGLWSKADSQVLFDDFQVSRVSRARD